LLVRPNLANPDTTEHSKGQLIVKLQPDRACLRSRGISRPFRDQLAVNSYTDHIISRFDIHAVPFAVPLRSRLGRNESIYAPRGIFRILVDNLDLIADVGRRRFRKFGEIRPLAIRFSNRAMSADRSRIEMPLFICGGMKYST
jgi:hypothetical protein